MIVIGDADNCILPLLGFGLDKEDSTNSLHEAHRRWRAQVGRYGSDSVSRSEWNTASRLPQHNLHTGNKLNRGNFGSRPSVPFSGLNSVIDKGREKEKII
jgi:hypothetical protein